MFLRLLSFAVLGILVSGCAATSSNEMMTQLQTRVGELEREVGTKDGEINDLRTEVQDLGYQLERMNAKNPRPAVATSIPVLSKEDGPIIRVSVAPEKVQSALQSAGYYKGNIDGKVGMKTREAIAEFQRDRGLKADGIVGRATWTELKTFLE